MDTEPEEELDENLAKTPYKNEHGLSHEEHKWINTWFVDLDQDFTDQTKVLESINGKLTFIVIIIIIGIVVSLFRGCTGL